MSPTRTTANLRQQMMQVLNLVEYEAVKRALLDAYVSADDDARVPLSFAYLKLFPRPVEAVVADLPAPRPTSTRECSACGTTVPAPHPSGLPDRWMIDPRSAEMVCGKCHGRRMADGWCPPPWYEVNHKRLAEARGALRTDVVEAQR